MDDWLVSMLMQVGTIVGVIIFMFLVFSWVTKGFLLQYLKVFASRGAKLLVEIKHPLNNYFCVGKVTNGFLIFKNNSSKSEKRVVLKEGVVNTWLGVKRVVIDEEDNFFVSPSRGVVSGFNADKFEQYAKDMYCLGKQDEINKQILIVIGILVLVCLFVSIFCLVQVFGLKDAVEVVRVTVVNSTRLNIL